jgi:predicted signal transduction protein with EAL and GGDEF domain
MLAVTASIGAAHYPAATGGGADAGIEAAIATADAALYRAKHAGRDRIALVDAVRGAGQPPCRIFRSDPDRAARAH